MIKSFKSNTLRGNLNFLAISPKNCLRVLLGNRKSPFTGGAEALGGKSDGSDGTPDGVLEVKRGNNLRQ